MAVESKYGFSATAKGMNGSNDDLGGPTYGGIPARQSTAHTTNGGGTQGIYGPGMFPLLHPTNGSETDRQFTTDLPPRIDRASKPPPTGAPSTPGSSLPSRNSSALHRSAHDRLFGQKSDVVEPPDYATRAQLIGNTSLDRQVNSSMERQKGPKMGNSYNDSVSSYDSYGPSQIAQRLGPNAPDDLKSVPTK